MIVDTHVHVVDPARYPVPAGPGYKPNRRDHGTSLELGAAIAAAGVTRAVVVALSGYGEDHRPVLDAVAADAKNRRGIVNLLSPPTGHAIDRLIAAGVVGFRVNLMNFGLNAAAALTAALPALVERGLIVQLQTPPELLLALDEVRSVQPRLVVIDHLGLPDVTRGVHDPSFREVLRFGERGAAIKVSGAFRASRSPFPHPDLEPFVGALRLAYPPEQRVWGSDWPFVGVARRPSYQQTLDLARRWFPEPAEQRAMLVETPSALFGF